jgi:hypothetical protein
MQACLCGLGEFLREAVEYCTAVGVAESTTAGSCIIFFLKSAV